MKKFKFFTILFITAVLSGCIIFEDKTPDISKELKVLVWNIWHGGHDEDLPRDGRPDVIEVIKSSEADIVLMIETYGSAPQIAKATGMNFAINSADPGDTGENLCIFSKYPILKKEFRTISSFNFISAVVDVQGTPVRVCDLWIDYKPDCAKVPVELTETEILDWENNEGDRISTLKRILKSLDKDIENSNTIPLIVGGDFNSNSHLDWVESTANIPLYGHNGKTVKWEVSSLMVDAGFTDSWREIYPDPSTNYGETWLSEEQTCRIDYLYYQGSKIKALKSETVAVGYGKDFTYREKNLMFPSDHGFVLTTFKIN
jgi:exonuclease III